LGFDGTEAASVAQPMLSNILNQLKSASSQAVTSARESSKAKGPFGALDLQLLTARMQQESLAEWSSVLVVKASGSDVIWELDRSRLGAAPPAILTVATVGALAAIAVPNFKAARERANFRACYANQKTVAGALELYNLDKNTKIRELTPQVWQDLKTGGYLQIVPIDPGQGEGSASNYYFTDKASSGIACRVHGSIQGEIKGALPAPR